MNTSSILTNSSALTALMSLNETQQALATTENQVSTGLKVGSAADNSSYWSIATQLTSNNSVIGSINDSLSQSQNVLGTANSAISSIITTINSIESTLTQATNPGANFTDIQTTLTALGKQITDAVNGANFNGLNLLNGSQTSLNFVSGLSGSTINSIAFSAQALTGSGGASSTYTAPAITDANTISTLKGLTDNHTTVTTPTYGVDQITQGASTITIASKALDGTVTTTTYSALDANGNSTTLAATGSAAATSLGVSITTTPGAGLLTVGSSDLTNLSVSDAASAQTALGNVQTALSNITNYAASIGATQDRMTAATTLNSAISTNLTNGVSSLVDANMNEASTRLQALQTQQQLGIQALSIANQNSQLILKLFP